LNRAQTAVQLTGILGAAPAAALVDGVFARSEGNPFFTEELLAAVQAGSRELPPTVGDLLRGRVQALSEPARQVLVVVAVAGRPAPHQLVAAIAGLDGRALVTALREAVAHQLLVIRPGEDGYTFRHALLGEVVEADLLPGERTRLHAACAQALASWPELGEAASAATKAELAVHWDAAGELARALPARVEAGIAAERARAFPEAARHYQRALELWTLVPEPGRPDWTGWTCSPGPPTRLRWPARSNTRSHCWRRHYELPTVRLSRSGRPCCWLGSVTTAVWSRPPPPPWPPTRQQNGC
jgi:predicted ATPase